MTSIFILEYAEKGSNHTKSISNMFVSCHEIGEHDLRENIHPCKNVHLFSISNHHYLNNCCLCDRTLIKLWQRITGLCGLVVNSHNLNYWNIRIYLTTSPDALAPTSRRYDLPHSSTLKGFIYVSMLFINETS